MQVIYEINPKTILYPAGEQAVLQLLGKHEGGVVNPNDAVDFLESFAAPASLDDARDRFARQRSAKAAAPTSDVSPVNAFDRLAKAAIDLGVLRKRESGENAPDGHSAKALLRALHMLAEDLTGDLLAMSTEADPFVIAHTGTPVDHILRHALGELTRISTALALNWNRYLATQLDRLSNTNKQPRLHLGAGGNSLNGWYNVDLSSAELCMNLCWDLPFYGDSIEFVFLAHLFEHLYKSRDVPKLLSEIRRVLKPGGIVRIIVPDARCYMRAYVENDEEFFAMQRKVWPEWAPKARTRLEAILGYLGAPEFPGGSDQHRYGYDFETLKMMLEDAGFQNVCRSTFMGSEHEALRVDDGSCVAGANVNGRYASLFVEARK